MYSTELMEQILTSEIGQQIIQRVTNKYGNSHARQKDWKRHIRCHFDVILIYSFQTKAFAPMLQV